MKRIIYLSLGAAASLGILFGLARFFAAAPASPKAPLAALAPAVAAESAPSTAPATEAASLPPAHVAPARPDSRALDAEAAQRVLAAMPVSLLRTALLRLDDEARARALRHLAERPVPSEDYASLQVSPSGHLYYACSFGLPTPGPSSLERNPLAAASHENASAAASTPSAAAVPIATPPLRHSRPGASKVIYLDFNGHTVTGTDWNTGDGAATYVAKPFSIDADATTFSDAEQAVILSVWERVAEDYAPFDVDVTTEEPASFNSNTGRALITPHIDANGVGLPSSSSGGVAYTDVFGLAQYATRFSPAFVYSDNLSNDAGFIAEATSHEVGHNMGLEHDGKTGDEYYDGHGSGDTSWGAIMGAGYNKNVTQWSKGEYYQANNPEDDLAILATKLGYRTDEAGATTATATAATVTGGNVTATGVLAGGDTDVFAVTTAAGTLNFSVATFRSPNGTHGGNADVKLELLNSSGTVVASADPAATTGASLSYAATAGNYFIRLTPAATGTPLASTPTGYTSYGSLGQYTLTGTIVAVSPAITSTTTASVAAGALFNYSIVATNGPTSYQATGLPAGLAIDTATGVISGRATMTGVFSVGLSATNSLGTGNATLTLTVSNAAPAISAQTSGSLVLAPGANQTLAVTALSANGAPTYQWQRNGRAIAGATNATYNLSGVTYAHSGYYRVLVTNPMGTTTSDAIFVRVAPAATQVVVWGSKMDSHTLVPVGVSDAVQVSVGLAFSTALRRDGTVVAWGNNAFNQLNVPVGLTDVVAIENGYYHALALKRDGTVVAWGYNGNNRATVPAGLTGVVAIAAGYEHSLALKNDGSVVAWGLNTAGQTTVPAGALSGVAAVGAGYAHSLALKADGSVVAWGENANGQTTVPGTATDVATVSGGYWHSLALKSDGTAIGWGNDSWGQRSLSGASTLRVLAAGAYHSVGAKPDGTVSAWGYNEDGQTVVPATLTGVFDVDANRNNSAALRDATGDTVPSISTHPLTQAAAEGTTVTLSVVASGGSSVLRYQWRKGGTALDGETSASLVLPSVALGAAGSYDVVVTNQLGTATSNPATLTVGPIPAISAQSAARHVLAPGAPLALSVTATGTGSLSYRWYRNGRAIAGATASSYNRSALTLADAGVYWLAITDTIGTRRSAPMFVLYAPTTTTVSGWGSNTSAQLTVPGDLTTAVAISAGSAHTLALKADGTVAAWGINTSGQTTVPSGLSGVVAISAGDNFSLALKSDGTVVAWGANTSGQSTVPTGLSNVVAIAGGGSHSLALKLDGTVVAWGNSFSGQTTIPTGLANVAGVGASANTSYALKSDGTLVAWGYNGNNETVLPVGLNTATALDGGSFHGLALKVDGTVVGWGFFTPANVPVGLANVIGVSGGNNHSLALKADGTVTAWGSNGSGQTTVPGGLNALIAVSAGNAFSLVLREIIVAPTIATPPASQTVAVGANVTFTVVVSGSTPFTYQWRKGTAPIDGATAASYTITGVASGDAGNYNVVVTNGADSATSADAVLAVNSLAQTITFNALADVAYTATPLTLSATASSGLAVSFSVVSGPATISGDQLTLTGPGAVTVRAAQAGNATYAVAASVDRTFNVTANFASWQRDNFTSLELANNAVSGPNAIYGVDGLTNLVKYALGLNPKTNVTSGLPEIATTATEWTYSYTRPAARPDLVYSVEVSTTLATWTTTNVIHELVSTDAGTGTQTWRARYPLASAANAFFRLKVTR